MNQSTMKNLLASTIFTYLFITTNIINTVHAFAFTLNDNHVVKSTTRISACTTTTQSKIILYVQSNTPTTTTNDYANPNRRSFLSQSIMSGLILSSSSKAAFAAGEGGDTSTSGEDMTTQMFNEDGSLKAGSTTADIEAKSSTVSILFPADPSNSDNDSSAKAIVSIDGSNANSAGVEDQGESSSSKIKTSYEIPDKWTPAPEYLDTLLSVREKACDHITVYQVPGTFKDNSILEKATTIGVAKALNFASTGQGVFPKALLSADVISGRKVTKVVSTNSDDSGEKKQKYYEFDLAVAPDTCGQSAENLNLGFCPYDTIVLISATIVDQKMMVCGVTCTKNEWKRANADLKRVRGSFFVESV